MVKNDALLVALGVVVSGAGLYVITLVNENMVILYPTLFLTLCGVALIGAGGAGLLGGSEEAPPPGHHH